jgi:hypothetical protein
MVRASPLESKIALASAAFLLWIWLVDAFGTPNPRVRDWPPFAALHQLRLWLSALLAAIIAGMVLKRP